uniref:Uncharacterized protein n=1 Tax=Photinus pyralis TaxID=7054 RepID=A0A1Y1KQI9_PHOPY
MPQVEIGFLLQNPRILTRQIAQIQDGFPENYFPVDSRLGNRIVLGLVQGDGVVKLGRLNATGSTDRLAVLFVDETHAARPRVLGRPQAEGGHENEVRQRYAAHRDTHRVDVVVVRNARLYYEIEPLRATVLWNLSYAVAVRIVAHRDEDHEETVRKVSLRNSNSSFATDRLPVTLEFDIVQRIMYGTRGVLYAHHHAHVILRFNFENNRLVVCLGAILRKAVKIVPRLARCNYRVVANARFDVRIGEINLQSVADVVVGRSRDRDDRSLIVFPGSETIKSADERGAKRTGAVHKSGVAGIACDD